MPDKKKIVCVCVAKGGNHHLKCIHVSHTHKVFQRLAFFWKKERFSDGQNLLANSIE